MSKKTQFTRSKVSWEVYKGTEIQRSYIPRLINLGFTRKEISEIMNLGVQLVSDYYNKYKETYG